MANDEIDLCESCGCYLDGYAALMLENSDISAQIDTLETERDELGRWLNGGHVEGFLVGAMREHDKAPIWSLTRDYVANVLQPALVRALAATQGDDDGK